MEQLSQKDLLQITYLQSRQNTSNVLLILCSHKACGGTKGETKNMIHYQVQVNFGLCGSVRISGRKASTNFQCLSKHKKKKKSYEFPRDLVLRNEL